MKGSLRALATCMLVTLGAGCAKTAVVFGENGIINAVTEAPTLRKRKTLIQETKVIVESACATYMPLAVGNGTPSTDNVSGSGSNGKTKNDKIADFKAIVGLAENVLDLVPSHSVAVIVDCQKMNRAADED